MGLILRIAFRNMLVHKGRSFAIGFVLVVGSFFMVLGNGTTIGMKKGIEKNIVKGTFGDITILSNKRMADTLSGSAEELEIIENYRDINTLLQKQEYIDYYLPLIIERLILLDVSMAQTQSDYGESAVFTGADFEKYNKIYGENIEVIEGALLNSGGKGLYINASVRDRLYNMYNIWLVPENAILAEKNLPEKALANIENLRTRSDLVVMGSTGTAMDVRVPIKGVFKYKNMNDLFKDFNLMDIDTMRESIGYISSDEIISKLPDEEKAVFEVGDDNLDTLFVITKEDANNALADFSQKKMSRPDTNAQNRESAASNSEVYTLIQLCIKDNISNTEAVNRLNHALKIAKLDKYVRAISWDKAWTFISNYINMFSIGLIAFVYILFFAAVLMITNALSMAAMERISEIGTMRTVGARKGFVSKMFVTETILLSLIFGGMGIILGVIAIKTFASLKLSTSVLLFHVLFGGNVYSPVLDGNGVVTVIIQLLFIAIIASIYPIIVARRIKPIDAIHV